MNQRGEQAENSGVPASRSALLPQSALPSPEMPVPAEITVREAATGPYTNHEQEEICLSCRMFFHSQLTITRSSGPLQGCWGPPTGEPGASALLHASNSTLCSPSGHIGWRAGSHLVTNCKSASEEALVCSQGTPREDLEEVLAYRHSPLFPRSGFGVGLHRPLHVQGVEAGKEQ